MLKSLLTMSILSLSLVTSSAFAADYKLYDGNQGVKGFDPSMIEGRFKIVNMSGKTKIMAFINKSFLEIHKLDGEVYQNLKKEFRNDSNIRGFVKNMEKRLKSDYFNDRVEKVFLNKIKGTNIKTVSEINTLSLDEKNLQNRNFLKEEDKTFKTLLAAKTIVMEQDEENGYDNNYVIPKDSIYIKSYSKLKLLDQVSEAYKRDYIRENNLIPQTKNIALSMSDLAKKLKVDDVYKMDAVLKIEALPLIVDVVNKDIIILYPLTFDKTPIVLERVSMDDEKYKPITYEEFLELYS
ncbi:hypothetical protein [Photobacterium leiognathi]|uniref:hypothetical protein n=1 Tax=Photobacterium leiognathi TaxID=553611 RepID=UPI0029819C4C|nr:hypothetical protein [Photobacterium leiognathi]